MEEMAWGCFSPVFLALFSATLFMQLANSLTFIKRIDVMVIVKMLLLF